ncbi:hypothetical protein ACLVWU_04315 [Bdellovibrio sp. HCB290]|uniref:hypothetical protein n=1 Tax=Bdellovibrio sp. HCB290 TaxID=3394356 RepID=UPI0039B4229B
MYSARWISLLVLIVSFSSTGWGAGYQSSSYAEKLVTRKNPLQGLSLVMPSFVVHGVSPGPNASGYMPRKVDGKGNTVITPGVGLEYVAGNGLTLLAAFVKDCYDNPAGALQIGETFKVSDRTQWGVTFGVYARQTPKTCETYFDGRREVTECWEIDGYRMKFMSTLGGHSVDIMPMPFVHFTTALFKSRDFRLDFKVMSNFVLNEFGFAVPF